MRAIDELRDVVVEMKSVIRSKGEFNPSRPKMGEEICSILSTIGFFSLNQFFAMTEKKSPKEKLFATMDYYNNIEHISVNQHRDSRIDDLTFNNAIDYIEEIVGDTLMERFYNCLNKSIRGEV